MIAPAPRHLAMLLCCIACGGGVHDTAVASPTAPSGTPSTGGGTPITVPTAVADFRGSVVLGSPATTSIRANLYAPSQAGTAFIAFGTTSGTYTRQTTPVPVVPDVPVELTVDGLSANTRYYYRLVFTPAGGSAGSVAERSFQTARTPGSTFVFGLQGDSHPERVRQQFDSTLYVRTLQAAGFEYRYTTRATVDRFCPKSLELARLAEKSKQGAKDGRRRAMPKVWLAPASLDAAEIGRLEQLVRASNDPIERLRHAADRGWRCPTRLGRMRRAVGALFVVVWYGLLASGCAGSGAAAPSTSVAVLDDLLALLEDLGLEQPLLGLAGEVRAGAHGDRPGEGLGQAGDDDQRLRRIGGGHAGDDAQRDEQAVLRPEHDLADPRQPRDALRLA